MSKRKTTEEFIKEAKEIHGDKYDYSKVEYTNNHTKVCIICPTHGEFWQTPTKHLCGCKCPKCSRYGRNVTTEEFIKEAKKIHGSKYDYSKVEYTNNRTKVCIICPIHGEFWQTPENHLQGNGCNKCAIIIRNKELSLTSTEFIERAKKVHGDKYNYSKVEYVNSKTKVLLICPIHGEFWQIPNDHLNGCGCPKCKINRLKEKNSFTTEEFIEKAKRVHGNKYDYSKIKYVNSFIKICIICPQHGEFWQQPSKHLCGCGCPKCNSSKLENEIRMFLEKNKIEFKEQKKFDWLGKQSLDFYLPSKNIAIECQGIQHFEKGGWCKSKLDLVKQYLIIKKRDERKRELCGQNGVKLLYYSNLGIEYPYHVYENKDELLKEILNENTINQPSERNET